MRGPQPPRSGAWGPCLQPARVCAGPAWVPWGGGRTRSLPARLRGASASPRAEPGAPSRRPRCRARSAPPPRSQQPGCCLAGNTLRCCARHTLCGPCVHLTRGERPAGQKGPCQGEPGLGRTARIPSSPPPPPLLASAGPRAGGRGRRWAGPQVGGAAGGRGRSLRASWGEGPGEHTSYSGRGGGGGVGEVAPADGRPHPPRGSPSHQRRGLR